MVRIIKVVLPLSSPKLTDLLCQKIVKKHLALVPNSPLTSFLDMDAFELRRAAASQLQADGDQRMADSQAIHGQAFMAAGIARGQNKSVVGSMYWYVLQIRDTLLTKNRGQEENLSQWGFAVVVSQTGARRNVRVDIPDDNVSDLAALAKSIKDRHAFLAAASPLLNTGLDMVDFVAKVDALLLLDEQWKEAHEDAQAFHGQSLSKWGYSEGQTSETPDTMYYDLITVRDRLLQVNQGQEENLSQWGFEVVITGHRAGHAAGAGSGGGGGTAAMILIIITDVNGGSTWNLDTGDAEITDEDSLKVEVSNSDFKIYASAAPNVLPGAAASVTITPLTPLITTVGALRAIIGSGPLMPYINAQNIGAVSGHIKITIGS